MAKRKLSLSLSSECFICYNKSKSYINTDTCPKHKACVRCFGIWFKSQLNNYRCPFCRQSYRTAYVLKSRKKRISGKFSSNLKISGHRYMITDLCVEDDVRVEDFEANFFSLNRLEYVKFRIDFIDLPKIDLISQLVRFREFKDKILLAIETDCLINNQEIEESKLKAIEVENSGYGVGHFVKIVWQYINGKEGYLRINNYKEESVSFFEIINGKGKLIFSKASLDYNSETMSE